MSQSGFTPISIYYSTTASAVPTAANLVPGELAINTADGKLYYEDSAGVVQVLATKSTGSIGGSNTQVQFNNSGSLGGSSGLTWDGSFLTTSSIKNSALTSGRVTYAGASGLLSDSANLTYNGTNLNISYADAAYNAGLTVTNTTNNIASQTKIYVLNSAGNYLSIGRNSVALGSQSTIFSTGNFPLDFYTDSTQKMTITGTGNVGIGTSSPSQLLHLNVASGSVYEQISSGANNVYIGFDSARTVGTIQSNNALTFDVGSSYTTRMTLDASGNLGLGVTPSAWATVVPVLQFSGGTSLAGFGNVGYLNANAYFDGSWRYIASAASGRYEVSDAHKWFSAASGTAGNAISFTQAMTLDASGNLLVGTTSTAGTVVGARMLPSGLIQGTKAGSTNADTQYDVYSTGASAYRFYVGMGGTIFATSIVISAISDQRLKENIRDLDTGLSTIMALKPRRFDWKEGKGQDKKNAAGFIAQEYQEVLPNSISTFKQGDDGIDYLTMNHEELIPTLVKAIQELKAEFDAYKATHP